MNGYSLEFVIFKICHVNETTKHLNIECDNVVMYGMLQSLSSDRYEIETCHY